MDIQRTDPMAGIYSGFCKAGQTERASDQLRDERIHHTEALDLLGPYLSAYRVDLKGFFDQVSARMTPAVQFQGVLEVINRGKHRWDMHIEIVTNLIPGISDD